MNPDLPALQELGDDLREVGNGSIVLSLLAPVVATGAYFVFAFNGWWIPAFFSVVYLSFCTYASTSHDLVHNSFRLPPKLNNTLLSAMELLCLRSGHAYRITHLHHHKIFPADDDIEARIACGSFWKMIFLLPLHQYRIWCWSLKRARGRERLWLIAEAVIPTTFIVFSIAALPFTPVFFVYTILAVGGSWFYPFATVYFPHDPEGTSQLTQTRLFRNRILDLISLGHLYHLEHHLYPSVPHQKWRELARRLDPYFSENGVKPYM